jgi:acyl-CoA thioesterase FadM
MIICNNEVECCAYNFAKIFFNTLNALGKFSVQIPVFFALTNAEGNVYQASFLSVLEEVKDRFIFEHLSNHDERLDQASYITKTKFSYIRNFYFGDMIEVELSVKQQDDKNGFVLEARFKNDGELHSIARQWINFEPQENLIIFYNPAVSGDFPYYLVATSPLLNERGYISIGKIAELFGDTREEIAIKFFPGFVDDVKKGCYSLVTRKACYKYFKPIYRGQKVYIQMRVLKKGKTDASFVLQADYTTKDFKRGFDVVNIRAEQEIVYVNSSGCPEKLPVKLMAAIDFSLNQQNKNCC